MKTIDEKELVGTLVKDCEDISPEDLHKYLIKKGWDKLSFEQKYDVYEHSNFSGRQILVSKDTNYDDYDEFVFLAIRKLSSIEKITCRKIIDEIKGVYRYAR